MRWIPENTKIDFINNRRWAYLFSAILTIVSLTSLAVQQLAWGIDFTGGVVIQVTYPQPVELDNVRAALAKGGYGDAMVQFFGTSSDILIRTDVEKGKKNSAISDEVLAALHAANSKADMQRVQFIGPQVGDELANRGGLALLYALIGILIYVLVRFHWKLAVGAVVAVFHDVIITLGFFSLFQIDFDLTVLAAVLAVIGYSVNDSVVVFDRIRENFPRMRKATAVEVMNASINQTLARTIMTGVSTLMVLIILLVLASETLGGFAIALLVGLIFGTYSSVFIASAFSADLNVTKEDLFPPKEEASKPH